MDLHDQPSLWTLITLLHFTDDWTRLVVTYKILFGQTSVVMMLWLKIPVASTLNINVYLQRFSQGFKNCDRGLLSL